MTTAYLIMAAAGFILAAWAFRRFRREQRRRRILARLARLDGCHGWPDEAGYYPGSLADPRD